MSDIKTPYLNGHMYEFDLCWLVEKILSFESQLNQAIDLKTIHYADPIQWDITTQYAPNTVVVDSKSGTAYMSKVPVPAGILLGNTDYWVVIFNYQEIYTKIMEGVAFYNGQTDYATKTLLVNDLVWYGLDLYRVTKPIEEGGKLIPETNMVKTSIESLLSNYYGRDRITTLLNDTLNVSGDYTINSGDIAETADNLTIKANHVHVDSTDPVYYKQPSIRGSLITIPINAPDGTTYQIPLYNHDANHVNIIDNTTEFTSVTEKGLVSTLGFYTTNDGGRGTYIVTDTVIVPDGHTVFGCADGLIAVLLPDCNTTFLTYGGKGDESGQSDILNSYFKYCVNNNISAIIPYKCKVGMNSDLFLPDSLRLELYGTLLDLSDIAIYNKDAYSDIRPGYTGNGNITITGSGVIDARADQFADHNSTTFRMMHGHDITIENITLKNFGGYHGIELISCENTVINNVTFDGFIISPSSSEHSNIESTIQIETAYAESGQSGATPYDKTPNKNITIKNCVFKGSEGKYINTGIESQTQTTTGETYYHENIEIYGNKFFNVEHHCIVPYRWTGACIHNNYAITTGGGFVANISGNLGFSLAESIIAENTIYDSAENETVAESGIFAINIHSASHVNISNNIIAGCKTGVLSLLGKCTRCKFNNNDATYISKLGSNMFYIENPETTCDIIGNTLTTDDNTNASLASLPPNNDKFNGIFLGNRIQGIEFQYRDNKLIGNGDVIYTGSKFSSEITPTTLCSVYSSIKIEFSIFDKTWERIYNLNDDVKTKETVILYNDPTSMLQIEYTIVIDTNTGKIYIQNQDEKILRIDGANSAITSTSFTAYVRRVVGIKNNIRN
nr:MAG TPA: Particle-associated glycoside hydrolase, Fri1, tailspike, Acinetobacter baumannii [Caudoviricetes sp.]